MKKTLILLPLAGLFLASCGGASNGELPSGGKEVDLSKEEDIVNFATRLTDDLAKTVAATKNGARVKGEIEINNFNVKLEGNADITLKDAKFTVDLAADFLDKNSVKDWKIAAEITAKGQFTLAVPEPTNINLNIDLNDIKLGAYLTGGGLYVDLSNEKLGAAVKNVAHALLLPSGATDKEKEAVDQMISTFLVKGKVSEFDKMIGDLKIKSDLSDSVKNEIKGAIAGFMAGLKDEEQVKDLLKFVSYDDGRLGISLSAADDKIIQEKGATGKGTLKASALFDKEGKFESLTEAGEFTSTLKEGDKLVATVSYKGSGKLEAEYSPKISFPDFSGYSEIDVQALSEILGGLM